MMWGSHADVMCYSLASVVHKDSETVCNIDFDIAKTFQLMM